MANKNPIPKDSHNGIPPPTSLNIPNKSQKLFSTFSIIDYEEKKLEYGQRKGVTLPTGKIVVVVICAGSSRCSPAATLGPDERHFVLMNCQHGIMHIEG